MATATVVQLQNIGVLLQARITLPKRENKATSGHILQVLIMQEKQQRVKEIKTETLLFFAANAFANETQTEYVLEVDYYADADNSFKIQYASADNKIGTLTVYKDYQNCPNQWTTYTKELGDFHAYRVDTGLGAKHYDEQGEHLGSSSSADAAFRINTGVDTYISGVRIYTPGYMELKDAIDSIEIADEYKADFTVPVATNDGVTIEWTSTNSAIAIDADGNATVTRHQTDDISGTLTAKAILDGYYIQKIFDTKVLTTKDFEVTLAKAPKKSPSVEYTEVKGETETKISYTVADNYSDDELAAVAIITETATGKIVAKKVGTTVKAGSTTTADVTIQNPAEGEELTHYVVNSIGAIVKNRAPSEISDFEVVSRTSGVTVQWSPVADDYNHVIYYVYKNGESEPWKVVNEGDPTTINVDVEQGESLSFAVKVVDHEYEETPMTQQLTGSIFVPVYYSQDELNESDIYPLSQSDYSKDKCTKVVNDKTGIDTTVGGTVPVTLKAISTVSGEERKIATNGAKTGASRIQWRADNIADDEGHVVIIVKYFDEGTGNVEFVYSCLEYEGKSGKAYTKTISDAIVLGGSNTWREETIIIEDAAFIALKGSDGKFANGVEGDDFFFRTSANNGEFAINKITVMPYKNY